LAARTPVLAGVDDGLVTVDVDDTVIEVHGHAKQGAGFGYSGVRGLNALLATPPRDHGVLDVSPTRIVNELTCGVEC
jgi:hypothetical protein